MFFDRKQAPPTVCFEFTLFGADLADNCSDFFKNMLIAFSFFLFHLFVTISVYLRAGTKLA